MMGLPNMNGIAKPANCLLIPLMSCLLGCEDRTPRLSPDQEIRRYTRVTVPADADDIRFHEIALMVRVVNARFDVATDHVEPFLDVNPMLPAGADLDVDGEQVSRMQMYGDKLEWWQVESLDEARCGERESIETLAKGQRVMLIYRVCIGRLDDAMSRVYLLHMSEPWGHAEGP